VLSILDTNWTPKIFINQSFLRTNRIERFPEDFTFQLTEKEADLLVSQSVIPSKQSLGGYLPYVFTHEGVALLSSVLRSKRAIQVNVAIMRAFVRLSQMLESNEELNRKFAAVIRKLGEHDKYFKVVFDELEKLSNPLTLPHRKIGFAMSDKD